LSQFSHLAHQLKPADWVQLFGTIASASLAVGGALIGVNLGNKNARKIQQEEADHQLERDRQTEAVRLNAMLQALREELSVSWNIYVVQVGQSVENAANDKQKPLPFWPCYGDYFVVFKANAANLGMIKTDDLRKALVATYIFAEGHIETYQTFNRFLADHHHANPSLPSNVEKALAALLDYHPRLLKSHNALKGLVKECCRLLDAELQSSPTSLYLINADVPEGLANI
jgi:hypothetical protein